MAGFMDDILSTTTSFRHSFAVERALRNAAADKRVTKTHIIECCLLGKHNIQRYINSFTKDDLEWIHEQQLKALGRKRR